MFNMASENNHYLTSQRLLALAEVVKATSHVLINHDDKFSVHDLETTKEAYQSAIQDINHIFKYST